MLEVLPCVRRAAPVARDAPDLPLPEAGRSLAGKDMPSGRLNTALDAARAGARAIRSWERKRGRLEIRSKNPGDLVTSADLASERAVMDVIGKAYPQDGMLSEESGLQGDLENCWVLDPLDGTTNFVHDLPDYCLALAYCRGGDPIVGVIYDIARDELYAAEKGSGARCNGAIIKASGRSKTSEALLAAVGSSGAGGDYWHLLGQASRAAAGMRRSGSAALDLAWVARGSIDVAFCRGLKYWDYAAGAVLISEAGGRCVAIAGGKFSPVFGQPVESFLCGAVRLVGGMHKRLAAGMPAADDRGRR